MTWPAGSSIRNWPPLARRWPPSAGTWGCPVRWPSPARGASSLSGNGLRGASPPGRIDVAASLALVPPAFAPEDLNRDGVVNAQDLAILLGAWGPCGDCDGGCAADLDGDCEVGATDLARVLSAW